MATVASGLNSGSGFGSSDTITSTTLNNHVNNATVTNILTADIADSSSKTTGVTFAKMQHISTEKLVGRTSSNEGDIEEVDIVGASGILLDEDTMSSDSATRGATQQSIKAYIDAEIDKTVGHNQTWKAVTRAFNTTYTNSTGKPIVVAVLATSSQADSAFVNITFTHADSSVATIRLAGSTNSGGAVNMSGNMIVPVGAQYYFTYGYGLNATLASFQFYELS